MFGLKIAGIKKFPFYVV